MPTADELPALAQEVEDYLTSLKVDDLTRYMARKYYPIAWNKPSVHLDGGIVSSSQGLMIHARGEEDLRVSESRVREREGRNTRRDQRIADKEFGARWIAWQEQCTQRNAWIEQANAEWRKRVGEMTKAMSQWKQYVEEARLEFQTRKLTPVPAQPSK